MTAKKKPLIYSPQFPYSGTPPVNFAKLFKGVTYNIGKLMEPITAAYCTQVRVVLAPPVVIRPIARNGYSVEFGIM
jgi:hypothetical protein